MVVYLGIVGSDRRWWKDGDERKVKELIRRIVRYWVRKYGDVMVVTGDCPYGGVDEWTVEVCKELGVKVRVVRSEGWGWKYWKVRNRRIAELVEALYCIDKKGREWSGGRWTMREAKRLGKWVKLIEV